MKLTPIQARIIGCLLEKETTTPEQYPLSLNALTNACNQKSNREPVYSLDEIAIQTELDALIKARLVIEKTGFGSRISKYQHRFCNSELGNIQLSEQERAIICVMLLRGPQTPGELRGRTSRLAKFEDMFEVEAVLQQLMQRQDGAYIVKLAKEPGKRDVRYAQLFSDDVSPQSIDETSKKNRHEEENQSTVVTTSQIDARVDALEHLIEKMQSDIEKLQHQLQQQQENTNKA